MMCLVVNVTYESLLSIFLCSKILLDDVLDDMPFMINIDAMLTLDDVNI